ncbi:MAG: PRC-barrel domain-containing protein [Proteobacteria bacterium]|nr:PRC-barrel domain-containing protein [Pseudomonadota bacterium]
MTGPINKKTSKITTLRGTLFATAAATAIAFAGPALATSAPVAESGASVNLAAADSASRKTAIKLNYAARASELIGKPVENRVGDVLGTVEDLILTRQDKVAYAVISVGGFLGIGNKLVAVPYDELEAQIGGGLVLDRSKENLKAETEFVFSDSRSDFKTAAGAEYDE